MACLRPERSEADPGSIGHMLSSQEGRGLGTLCITVAQAVQLALKWPLQPTSLWVNSVFMQKRSRRVMSKILPLQWRVQCSCLLWTQSPEWPGSQLHSGPLPGTKRLAHRQHHLGSCCLDFYKTWIRRPGGREVGANWRNEATQWAQQLGFMKCHPLLWICVNNQRAFSADVGMGDWMSCACPGHPTFPARLISPLLTLGQAAP